MAAPHHAQYGDGREGDAVPYDVEVEEILQDATVPATHRATEGATLLQASRVPNMFLTAGKSGLIQLDLACVSDALERTQVTVKDGLSGAVSREDAVCDVMRLAAALTLKCTPRVDVVFHCDMYGILHSSSIDVRIHMRRILDWSEQVAGSTFPADGVYVNGKCHMRCELDACLWHFLPQPLCSNHTLHVVLYRNLAVVE